MRSPGPPIKVPRNRYLICEWGPQPKGHTRATHVVIGDGSHEWTLRWRHKTPQLVGCNNDSWTNSVISWPHLADWRGVCQPKPRIFCASRLPQQKVFEFTKMYVWDLSKGESKRCSLTHFRFRITHVSW